MTQSLTTPRPWAGRRSPEPGVESGPTSPRAPSAGRSRRIEGFDGLRAVAVVAVLAFHLWPAAVPGGFVGVDAFFVVSGFLITTLLIRERRAQGSVDLGSFWSRRARRLLPALVVVLVVSIAAARIVDGDLLVGVRRQVVAALTFSTNWVEIVAGTNYFNSSSPSLFATFWSLAVEEQFYVLWPLVFGLLAARRVGFGRIAKGAVSVALLSALLMAVLRWNGASTTRVYYGTDAHLFGLLVGIALAFAFAGGRGFLRSGRWERMREVVGYVGLAALLVLVVVLDGESSWTYPLGLLGASAAAALVVAALPGEPTSFTATMSRRPLVWIGSRSYGIYLWHWPVITIVTAAVSPGRAEAGASSGVAVVSLALTLVLSELSFRWVETPIRRDGFVAVAASVRRAFSGARLGDRRPVAWWFYGTLVAAWSVLALVGVATEPERSDAQASVEAGLAAIAAHERDAPAATVPAGPARAVVADVTQDWLNEPAWPAGQAVPTGDRMVGIGDSVMSGAAPALYTRFPGIVVNARPIRQWKNAPAIVDAMLRKGQMRRVVVLNFGTNAGLVSTQSQEALRHVLDALGPRRRVVLFDTVGVSKWVPSSNDTLRAIAADYPNVAVAEWNHVVNSFPGLLHRDRTHPNMDGIAAYAELLSQTLAELGPGDGSS